MRMAQAWKIAIEPTLESDDINVIVGGLKDYNAARTNGDTPDYFLVSVRDAEGRMVGGLLGATYLGWTQVSALWMPEALRGQGIGTQLMAQAETLARERGCPRMFLETLSFQALPFYEKLGYRVVSRIDDFPPGGARYALTRHLAAQPA
jgi:GNAT superfamily N-acetyltransferase